MLPEQDPPKNSLHLWTLKSKVHTVSNGVSIREYSCPLRFRCICRVGVRIVKGYNFIQLEQPCHVGHTMDDGCDKQQDLIDESEDD